MAIKPKLRIFAGPNGSGKTLLYNSIKHIYFSTRLFVNADNLESDFKKNNFLNLSELMSFVCKANLKNSICKMVCFLKLASKRKAGI